MGGWWPDRLYLELLSLFLLCLAFLAIGRWCQYPAGPKVAAYSLLRTWQREREMRRTAGWPSLSGEHFTLRYQPGTDPRMAQLVLQTAESYYQPVKDYLGGAAPERIPLVVYRNRESLGAGFGWGAEESAMGVYWAGVIRILSPSDWIAARRPEEVAAVFRREGPIVHELAHLWVDYRAAGNYPRWLTEGLAQQVERAVTGYVFPPAAAEAEGKWFPLADLDRDFDNLGDQALAYRQSLLLLDYLCQEYGAAAPEALLEALGRGRTLNQAVRDVTGKTVAALEAGFRTWAAYAADHREVAAARDEGYGRYRIGRQNPKEAVEDVITRPTGTL